MVGVQQHYDLVKKLYDLDVVYCDSSLYKIIDTVVDAISEELEVKPTNSEAARFWEPVIHTYCYSKDFGRNYGESDFLVKIDDKEYKPKSFSTLYDLLIELYHKEE